MDTEDDRCEGAHDREIANNDRELVANERELESKYWLHPFEIGVMKERRSSILVSSCEFVGYSMTTSSD